MSWESLKLLNRSGHPLTGSQREIILKGVEKVLSSPYVKLETVLRTAVNVARNIDCARDPSAYANWSFFRVDKNARIAARKEAALTEQLGPQHLNSQAATLRAVEPIEQQVLIRELFEQLDGLEREIYLARLSGDSFKPLSCCSDNNPRQWVHSSCFSSPMSAACCPKRQITRCGSRSAHRRIRRSFFVNSTQNVFYHTVQQNI
jgi:hypothetical protein